MSAIRIDPKDLEDQNSSTQNPEANLQQTPQIDTATILASLPPKPIIMNSVPSVSSAPSQMITPPLAPAQNVNSKPDLIISSAGESTEVSGSGKFPLMKTLFVLLAFLVIAAIVAGAISSVSAINPLQ